MFFFLLSRVLLTIVETEIDKTMLYYGTEDGSKLGAHFSFNYQLVKNLNSGSTARDFVDAINIWMNYMPLQHTANWIVGTNNQFQKPP